MTEDKKSTVFFENVLLKLLFINEKVRDRIIPFLSPQLFDNKCNSNIVKETFDFEQKFNKFPNFSEIKLAISEPLTYEHLIEIINLDISEYNNEFVLSELEQFIRNKLVNNVIFDVAEGLNESDYKKITACVDRLRDAVIFSFDTQIGIDFFNSEAILFESLHNKDKLVPTGIKQLDHVLCGGFHEKSLTMFMGAISVGKTLVLSSLAVNNILNNKNVLYITLEISDKLLSHRMLANMLDTPLNMLPMKAKEEFHGMFANISNHMENRLFVKEYPPRTITANHIRNLLKELSIKQKFIPDVIYVDYIELMLPIHNNHAETTFTEIKRVSEELRAVSVETGIPVVSAVQINREAMKAERVSLTDVSQSIGIAATADLIVGIHQTEAMKAISKYNWLILKNRFGKRGDSIPIDVSLEKMRVQEVEKDAPTVSSKAQPRTVISDQENVDNVSKDVMNFMLDNVSAEFDDRMKAGIDGVDSTNASGDNDDNK